MKKGRVLCRNCGRPVAFTIDWRSLPDIYCYACEDFVTHQEEAREESLAVYRAAANRL